MNKTVYLTAALFLAGTSVMIGQQADSRTDSPDVQLKAAVTRELVDGEITAAIQRYRAIATRYRTSHRSVAAKALVQMARTYEKLASPEARKTYEEVLRDFADQPEALEAHGRLAVVGRARAQSDVSPRRVLEGGWAAMFDISPDGRLTVGPERAGYDAYSIVLREVLTGRATTLVAGSTGRGGFQARISNDGRRVTYNWWEQEDPSLRVIGIEAGETPTIVRAPQATMAPVDWSPDGKAVLMVIQRYSDAAMQQPTFRELAWVSLESKAIRTIKKFESWQSPYFDARVSPDGGFIAFSAKPRSDSTDRYLYIIDANGQREAAVVNAAGSRESPVWTPDGAHLIFAGTTAGRSALWSIGIQNGQATGEPFVIQPDFAGQPIGMTTSGSFFYTRSVAGGNQEYVVNRNAPASDRVLMFPGLSAIWSPDGGSLAYVRPSEPAKLELIIRSVATGEERSYQHDGISVVSPRWLHDGSGVIVVVNEQVDGRENHAFHLVDVRTGTFRRLFDRDANGHSRTGVGAMSRDDKTLYLGMRDTPTSPVTGIVAVEVATGEERPVASFTPGTGPASSFGIALSPDGATLAVTAWTKANAAARIFTVGVNGANYREVFGPFETGWTSDATRWTPDGRTLVFLAFDANKNWRVMRVPVEGGKAEFDGLDFDTLAPLLPGLRMFPANFNNLDLSPDGSRVIVSTLTQSSHELWTLDGLLSAVSSR